MLWNLSDEVRARTIDAVRNGTGKVKLRQSAWRRTRRNLCSCRRMG